MAEQQITRGVYPKTQVTFGMLDEIEAETVSVTDGEGSISFSKEKNTIFIKNKGNEDIYITFDKTATATTSDTLILEGGDSKAIDGLCNSIHFICGAGKSSTLRVEAI